ncbi:hypothetical protein Premu_0210 [Hallella multisaccharivorax DSM 17128]|uniref:Uncharacterized protein n=1 Tax=Hallella multisaccharivorax DSM 17128 TaxID=688246 RepID=F8N9I2_9BACT|nr:hypothetical protein Premu_0210 [Hallella multisaccharivorax DSM 17128]
MGRPFLGRPIPIKKSFFNTNTKPYSYLLAKFAKFQTSHTTM